MVLTYEILTGYENFLLLEKDWTELLNNLPFYPPTSTHCWLKAWIKANKETIRSLHIILIRDYSDTLIGLIPIYCYQSKMLFFHMKALSLMGGREQMMADLIVLPEHQQTVANLLIEIIFKEFRSWDIFSFRHLDYSRGNTISLGRILHKRNIMHSSESRFHIPYLVLEGDWESYYASRKKRFKKEIRRKNKKLAEQGAIGYSVTESPMPVAELNSFLNLENKGWKGKNGSSILRRPHLLKLYQQLASVKSDVLSLCTFNLLLEEKVISSSICFKTPLGLYVFKITYDEELARFSPGLLLRLYELQYAYEQNLKIYDFSGPAAPWMNFFTDRSHYSLDIIIYQRHLRSLLRYIGYTRLRSAFGRWPTVKKFFQTYINE